MNEIQQKNSIMERPAVVWLCAMLCCALWGSAFPSVKMVYRLFSIGAEDTASLILIAGCRFSLAGLIVIAVISIQAGKLVLPVKGDGKYILTLSLFQTIGQYAFYFIGLAHMAGVKASIMDGMNTFFSILIAVYLFHQEKMTGRKILGCLIGFAGLVLVSMDGSSISWDFHILGEGFMILSALSASFSTCLIRMFTQQRSPAMLSGYQFLLGGLMMIAAGLAAGGHLTMTSFFTIPLLLYCALISSVAYTLWSVLLKHNPVSRIAVFGFMTQVFGVAISAVVLSESSLLTWTLLLSLILVCTGIYIVNRE